MYIYIYIYTHVPLRPTPRSRSTQTRHMLSLGQEASWPRARASGSTAWTWLGRRASWTRCSIAVSRPLATSAARLKAIRADPEEFLEAEVMQEATPIVVAKSLMPSLLDEATLASKHACALSVYGLSFEQIEKLESHSLFCRKTYQKLQKIPMEKDPAPNIVDAVVQKVPN